MPGYEPQFRGRTLTVASRIWPQSYLPVDVDGAIRAMRPPPAGKRYPVTSIESQVYIDTGEWPEAEIAASGYHIATATPDDIGIPMLAPRALDRAEGWSDQRSDQQFAARASLYANAIRASRTYRAGFDVRHIEAYMRLEHATLDGLSGWQFDEEVATGICCIEQGGLTAAEELAQSYGL